MHLPLIKPEDNLFEALLQDLPQDLISLAYEHDAFQRSRKIKDPKQLFRLILLYSGLDLSLKETSYIFSSLDIPLSDTAVEKRLKSSAVSYLKT